MELNSTDLEEIERLAAAAYTPKQVAKILGIKPSAFAAAMADEDSDISVAYDKGFFTSELKVREAIMVLARNGSSPAQTLANKLFDENRIQLTKTGHSAFE